jgi:hypothetical protein
MMHTRAFYGREAIFPEGYIAILKNMKTLAVTLRKQGKLEEAAELISKALDRYARWQGEDYEKTIRTRKDLAVI